MNDKRDEIRKTIAEGVCPLCTKYRFDIAGCKDEQYWGAPCPEAFKIASGIIERINPLVVIPDGDATTPRELMAEKHYTGEMDRIYRESEANMKQAGWVLGKKLVEE